MISHIPGFKSKASRGRRGERIAAWHLRRSGCRVLARNLRNRFGEVDLLAEAPDGAMVIVEVKTGTPGQAPPEWRVNRAKQARLIALGAQLARRYRLTRRRFRFDIVAVELPPSGAPVVRHIAGAFETRL